MNYTRQSCYIVTVDTRGTELHLKRAFYRSHPIYQNTDTNNVSIAHDTGVHLVSLLIRFPKTFQSWEYQDIFTFL